MCDFEGFIEPEMVKKRPVVVIARSRTNSKLVTVVPLSTTEPDEMAAHHYQLPRNPVPASKGKKCWAKCDMVATLSIMRMDRLKDGWDRVVPEVSNADLQAIRLCVVDALQLQNTILASRESVAKASAEETELVLMAAGSTTVNVLIVSADVESGDV